uniref:Helicase C-terminal domain-containing protein n=1 Tax=Romanomermis culicivorax TaxID=13658 RepID=A0A915JRB4_ROMCU
GTSSAKTETRIIIFSQYRESVEEITAVLRKHQPLIRPMKFIGQSFSAGKTTKGLTQKEQLRVMKEFKAGNYNTIVATCVAEEGLDIAEVDLIICYDAPKSPIRLVQRMGRTGRKRLGKIVVLLTKGREENCFDRSENSKNSVYKTMLQIDKFEVSPHNPRMIPLGLTPRCEKQFMEQLKPFENTKGKRKEKKSDAQPTSDNFLNDQQLKEWKNQLILNHGISEWSKICEKSLRFAFRRLKSDRSGKLESRGQQYDVNQYYLWQNESQKTFGIGHSTKSSLLVDLSKKCQYLSRLDDEGDFDPDDYYFAPNFDSFHHRTVPSFEKSESTAKEKKTVENCELKRDRNLVLKTLYYGIEFSNLNTLCTKDDSCVSVHGFVNFETWRERRQILRETENESTAREERLVSKNETMEYCKTSQHSLAEKSSNLDITFDFNLCTSLEDMFNHIAGHCVIDNEPQSTAEPEATNTRTFDSLRPPLTNLSPICHSKSALKGVTPATCVATKRWSTPKPTLSTYTTVNLENFDQDFSFDFGLDTSQNSISSPLPSSSQVSDGQVECKIIPLERT